MTAKARRRFLRRLVIRVLAGVVVVVGTSPGPAFADNDAVPASAAGRVASNPSEGLKRANDATVRIRAERRSGGRRSYQSGAGVILTYDGYIVTANHVVAGYERIRVSTVAGDLLQARVVLADTARDLALLKVTPSRPLKPAVLAPNASVQTGSKVHLIGNPLGMGQSVKQAVLGSARLTTLDGRWAALHRVQGNVQPGHSGGGAYDSETGALVGLVLARSTVERDTGYILPVDRLLAFLNRKRAVLELVDAQEIDNELGVRFRPVTLIDSGQRRGLLVTSVRPGSRADQAGWLAGDVLLILGQYQMINVDAIVYSLRHRKGDSDDVQFLLARGDVQTEGLLSLREPEISPEVASAALAGSTVADSLEREWVSNVGTPRVFARRPESLVSR